MTKRTVIALFLLVLLVFAGCKPAEQPQVMDAPADSTESIPVAADPETQPPASPSIDTPTPAFSINVEGMTVASRFPAPDGFARADEPDNSFGSFLRNQPLLPDGTPVHLYDGSVKGGDVAAAVLSIDVGEKDLQQCADAALRLRAEYLFAQGRTADIAFHLTNGFLLPYEKFRVGYRLSVNGNNTTLVKSGQPDDSYAEFRRYCDTLFTYAGTLSLSHECKPVNDDDIRIGDLFLMGGSPGHCVIVVDRCENPQTGEIAFLLAQSYMPAQQIHVLKNPGHEAPWYFASELRYPFDTPQWTFESGSHRRFPGA